MISSRIYVLDYIKLKFDELKDFKGMNMEFPICLLLIERDNWATNYR